MSYRVLLVDDEPTIKLGLRQALDWDSTPYTLYATASNGEEALEILRSGEADMVVTDLKMPVKDGIELIRQMKADRMEQPVLILSNYSDFDLVRQALLEGAVDYLLKVNISGPALERQLDKMAERIESGRRAREENRRQETLLRHQKQRVAENVLRDYFRDENDGLQELRAQGLLPPELEKEICLLTISFPQGVMGKEKLKRIAPNIVRLLMQAFSLPETPFSLVVRNHCMLCFLPMSGVETAGFTDAVGIAGRQLSTFFSAGALLGYAFSVRGVEAAKAAYQRSLQAMEGHFYHPERLAFSAEGSAFVEQPDQEAVSHALKEALEALRGRIPEKAARRVKELLNSWKDQPLLPEQARLQAVRLLDFLEYSAGITAAQSAIQTRREAIASAGNFDVLCEQVLQGMDILYTEHEREFECYRSEIQLVLRYVGAHFTENLTLDSIADAARLNRSYLCRLFKKEVGGSIFQYINRLRMEKAANLLTNRPGIMIKEVAEQIGMDEPFYFTRRFKDYYGLPPREWLQKQLQEQPERLS